MNTESSTVEVPDPDLFDGTFDVYEVDETPVGLRRRAVGVLALALGLACFVPVPIAISL